MVVWPRGSGASFQEVCTSGSMGSTRCSSGPLQMMSFAADCITTPCGSLFNAHKGESVPKRNITWALEPAEVLEAMRRLLLRVSAIWAHDWQPLMRS